MKLRPLMQQDTNYGSPGSPELWEEFVFELKGEKNKNNVSNSFLILSVLYVLFILHIWVLIVIYIFSVFLQVSVNFYFLTKILFSGQ